MKTIEECGYIYELAKNLMDKREKDYEGSWRTEGLGCMVASLKKKGSQAQVMVDNGRVFENPRRSKEDLLDAINYAVFSYRLLEMDENCKVCKETQGYKMEKGIGCPFDGVNPLQCGNRIGVK